MLKYLNNLIYLNKWEMGNFKTDENEVLKE